MHTKVRVHSFKNLHAILWICKTIIMSAAVISSSSFMLHAGSRPLLPHDSASPLLRVRMDYRDNNYRSGVDNSGAWSSLDKNLGEPEGLERATTRSRSPLLEALSSMPVHSLELDRKLHVCAAFRASRVMKRSITTSVGVAVASRAQAEKDGCSPPPAACVRHRTIALATQ